jgi:hypothetical protein
VRSWPHGYLTVACNERAFTQKDVVAVCDISHSTKSSERKKTGKKGIGFKTCFCASDSVHVFLGGRVSPCFTVCRQAFKHPGALAHRHIIGNRCSVLALPPCSNHALFAPLNRHVGAASNALLCHLLAFFALAV